MQGPIFLSSMCKIRRRGKNKSRAVFGRMECIGRGGGSCSFQFQTVSTKRPTEHNFLASILLCHCCHVNRGPDETGRDRGVRRKAKWLPLWSKLLLYIIITSWTEKRSFLFIYFLEIPINFSCTFSRTLFSVPPHQASLRHLVSTKAAS